MNGAVKKGQGLPCKCPPKLNWGTWLWLGLYLKELLSVHSSTFWDVSGRQTPFVSCFGWPLPWELALLQAWQLWLNQGNRVHNNWAAQCGPGELPNNSVSKHSGLTWLRCRWSMSHSLKFRAETAFPGTIVLKTVVSNTIPDAAETTSARQNQTGEDFYDTNQKHK